MKSDQVVASYSNKLSEIILCGNINQLRSEWYAL